MVVVGTLTILEGLNICRRRPGEIFTGRKQWLFPVACCPGDGSRQGARVVGNSQEKKVTAGVGAGRGGGGAGAGSREKWEGFRDEL